MHSQYNTIITIIIAMHTPGELFISLCVCDCELSDGALYTGGIVHCAVVCYNEVINEEEN